MKKQEKTIIEIRSKEKVFKESKPRWVLKKSLAENAWKHYCSYADEVTTVHFDKETKRGFTFRIYFAGWYQNFFISRSECEVVYEL